MPLADLSVTAVDGVPPRLEVAGELDLNTAPTLTARIRAVRVVGDLLVDLGEVSFMDSRGMQALLDAQRELRRHGADLVLGDVSPPARKVLELTQLWDLFRHACPEHGSS
jgi:anti-anti-sigma factor